MNRKITPIIREYDCRLCKQSHKIDLNNQLLIDHDEYPFPYTFLHGELKNLLTTLYIDRNLEIRGVEVRELKDSDLFSKDQVLTITNTLMKEIEQLREENNSLRDELMTIKKSFIK
jgi:hypothetical protein